MIFLFLFVLSACSSVNQIANPDIYYKRDMKVTANGFQFEGVGVLPLQDIYKMGVDAKGKLDLFTMTTCHREYSKEDAGKSGFFGDKKRVDFSYQPVKGIEDKPACNLNLAGYEKLAGRHSWAFVDLETPETTLPALVKCNGSTYNSRGVTVCQSRAGLIQEIEFSEPVRFGHKKECAVPQTVDQKKFSISLSAKECVYAFKGVDKIHRLTTLGYEDILVRGD